jgi:hypothetical protein
MPPCACTTRAHRVHARTHARTRDPFEEQSDRIARHRRVLLLKSAALQKPPRADNTIGTI